jgi:hypothetical protein
MILTRHRTSNFTGSFRRTPRADDVPSLADLRGNVRKEGAMIIFSTSPFTPFSITGLVLIGRRSTTQRVRRGDVATDTRSRSSRLA